MAQLWESNESKDADEELVVTDHRESDEPHVTPDDDLSVETTASNPQEALEALGEDASSSPARRGHEDLD